MDMIPTHGIGNLTVSQLGKWAQCPATALYKTHRSYGQLLEAIAEVETRLICDTARKELVATRLPRAADRLDVAIAACIRLVASRPVGIALAACRALLGGEHARLVPVQDPSRSPRGLMMSLAHEICQEHRCPQMAPTLGASLAAATEGLMLQATREAATRPIDEIIRQAQSTMRFIVLGALGSAVSMVDGNRPIKPRQRRL